MKEKNTRKKKNKAHRTGGTRSQLGDAASPYLNSVSEVMGSVQGLRPAPTVSTTSKRKVSVTGSKASKTSKTS